MGVWSLATQDLAEGRMGGPGQARKDGKSKSTPAGDI